MRIERFVGNTKRIRRQVVDGSGTAIDVTGHTFVLTVNRENDPVDTDEQLFQITATLETPASGLIYFIISPTNAAHSPSTYFYDILWTDNLGETQTLEKGEYVVCAKINQA